MRLSARGRLYMYFLTFENLVTNENTNLLKTHRIKIKVQLIFILIQIFIKVETTMYVCLCKGITQQQIQQAVENGDSYAQIRQKMGVGTDCGCCGQSAKQVIREHSNKMPVCEFAEAS